MSSKSFFGTTVAGTTMLLLAIGAVTGSPQAFAFESMTNNAPASSLVPGYAMLFMAGVIGFLFLIFLNRALKSTWHSSYKLTR